MSASRPSSGRRIAARVYHAIKDRRQAIARRFPGDHAGLPSHGLSALQVYPKGTNFDAVLADALEQAGPAWKVTKSTPLASIGSCFAEEFAGYMLSNGYNYLQFEGDAFRASANWGRVYTVPNLRQIVDYSFDPDCPVSVESSARGWFDPLREHTTPFDATETKARETIARHRKASARAFREAEMLIVTLGQNESWKDLSTGLIWARVPPRDVLEKNPGRFSAVEFSYAQVVSTLTSVVRDLLVANPRLRLLFTVSPVPAHATFTGANVVTQSFASKCLLRAALQEVLPAFPARTLYFPSFEMVLADNPHHFMADNRHVQNRMVRRIFGLFRRALSR